MIDWQLELDSAENNLHRQDCCLKFIDLARQILMERDAYREVAINLVDAGGSMEPGEFVDKEAAEIVAGLGRDNAERN